ncbi:MAG: LicD family protein [Bacillota bacterium]|nr:LicD family protein [Bacillota bacterium]
MLSRYLSEYDFDCIKIPRLPEDFDFSHFRNKTIVISGQAVFARYVVYSLICKNEEKSLGMNLIFTAEGDSWRTQFYPEIEKRDDFRVIPLSSIISVQADYIISTGCCNIELNDQIETFQAETEQIKKLLQYAAMAKPKRFILLSDYRAFGNAPKGVVMSEYENGLLQFSKPSGLVAQTVLTLESLCSIYSKQYGFEHLILRTGHIISPNGGLLDNLFTKIMDNVAKGEEAIVEAGHGKNTYVYMTDVLQAVFYGVSFLRSKTVYNVAGKDATVSAVALCSMIYDIYPELFKISIQYQAEESAKDISIDNSKLTFYGCEPQLSLEDAIELFCKARQKGAEPFRFDDSYCGKLETIHNILLGFMLEVDRICKKHDIKYFLAGGTLLGAVRHGGFIPWDDDADVMMLRPDYDKFLKVAQAELPPNLFLHTPKTDKLCNNCFAKIRINNTMFATEYSSKTLDMHNGIFFDVLCHDQTANSALGRKLHLAFTILARSLVFNKWYHRKVDNGSKIPSAITTVIKNILPMKFHLWFQERMFLLFKNKKDAKYLFDDMGRNIRRGSFSKEYLDETIEVDFEGYKFPIPKRYDEYLTYLYGNYKEMSSASLRRSSHSLSLMDLGEYGKFEL